MVKRVLNGNLEGKRGIARPKDRNRVESDLRTLEKRERWRGLAEEREREKASRGGQSTQD